MHPFDRVLRFVLPPGAVAVLATVLGIGWFTQPDRYAKGYAPSQPIAFSHRLHAGTLAMPCNYCHSGADRSRIAGIPSVDECMGCHGVTKPEAPEIRKLASIYDRGEALVWQRVYSLPDHAFFDHRPHIKAGMLCQNCHGEVQNMNVLSRQMSLRMGNCLGCHRDPRAALPKDTAIKHAREDCFACHR